MPGRARRRSQTSSEAAASNGKESRRASTSRKEGSTGKAAWHQSWVARIAVIVAAASVIVVLFSDQLFGRGQWHNVKPACPDWVDLQRQNQTSRRCEEGQPSCDGSSTIPTIDWTDFDASAMAISSLRRPVLIKNTPAAYWPALKQWGQTRLSRDCHSARVAFPSYLPKHVPTLTDIFTSPRPSYIYHENGRPLAAPNDRQGATDMATTDVLERIQDCNFERDGQPYLYYSKAIKHNDFHPVRSDIDPKPFFLTDNQGDEKLDPESNVHVWIGPGSFQTHMHYDLYDNFYMQVAGIKQFVLVHPNQTSSVGLYPGFHEYNRQVHVGRTKSWPANGTSLSKPQGDIVVLRPGDVLFIPAMTFHHVTTLSPSISVNVFSHSIESLLSRHLFDMQLPRLLAEQHSDQLSGRQKIRGLVYFIRQLLQTALSLSLDEALQLIREHVAARFLPIGDVLECDPFEPDRCPADGTIDSYADVADIQDYARAFTKSLEDGRAERLSRLRSLSTGKVNARMAAAMSRLSDQFESYMQATRRLLVTDMIDFAAHRIMGTSTACRILRCAGEQTAFVFDPPQM